MVIKLSYNPPMVREGFKLKNEVCNKKQYKKLKVKESRYRPGVAQEVKVPRFHDNGTGWW
jgi:hypothetical protein